MINKLLKRLLNFMFKARFTLYDSMEEYENAKTEENTVKYTFTWWVQITLKIFMIIFVVILSLVLFGCAAAQPKIEYVPVSIPIKCTIPEPQRPQPSGDIIKDNLLILKYSDEMRIALRKCK